MGQNKFFCFLLVFSQWSFSQAEKKIDGRIVVKNAMTGGIHVINLVNEREALSNDKGEFTIPAKAGDVLVFSAIHLDLMRKVIEDEDYASGFFTMEMTSKINRLDEVRVNRIRMDAVSMGILERPAKVYTPAERRLKTTGDFKPVDLLQLLGGQLPLDPIINAINGRTALMKANIKIEKRELLLKKLSQYYDEGYYIQNLHIQKQYVKGFQYYCMGDAAFCESLEGANKFMTAFLLGKLAAQYNNLTHYESK